jgi:YD repeat-containing protein
MYKAGDKFTFSETGGPLSDADTSGNAIIFHWGKKGLESITNTAGSTFTRTFYKLKTGFEVTSTWRDTTSGKEVKYAYNSGDKLETYTDAEGHQTKYAYNTEGELSEITAPSGAVTKLYYAADKSQRINKIEGAESNGSNGTWEYTYYEAGKAPAPCTATQKAVAATSPERGGLYCANPFDEVEQVRELKPPVFSGFEVSAYDESATSPTVFYFSEAEDPLLPDGSPGPGVATYSYRYSVNGGPFSSWAQTEFAEAETPHIPVGATVAIQVYAVDNAGNVSQVVAASTAVAEEEVESVTGREEWEAELAEIEAETEAPPETYIAGPEYLEEGEYGGSPAFTRDVNRTDRLTPKPARPPAALYAAPYLNSKFRGGQWTCRGNYDTISNKASGVAIGNCKGGWILNSQQLSDPNEEGKRYAGGYIGGSYNGCGWLNETAAGKRDPTTYKGCANPDVPYGRVGVVYNAKVTTDGTPFAVATNTCTAYANFRPFSRHYGPANKLGSNVPKGTMLMWRYVAGVGGTHRGYEHANGDLWVMVRNTKPSTSGGVSWVFVPYHGCFGASPKLPKLPGKSYWHP